MLAISLRAFTIFLRDEYGQRVSKGCLSGEEGFEWVLGFFDTPLITH